MTAQEEFSGLLGRYWPELPAEAHQRLVDFYALLRDENEIQNLTRLVSPKDFLEGHIVDVRELGESGFVRTPAADLGSGCGVPGLLMAAIWGGEWSLVESEKRKADFLVRAAQALGLKRVGVFPDRVEDFARKQPIDSYCARALGPLSRIYGWVGKCSTWNRLVLLKGPKWEDEWAEFQSNPRTRNRLKLTGTRRYEVGAEKKKRIIVALDRP